MARRALVRAFVLIVLVSCSAPALHAQPPPESRMSALGADTVRATVTEIATLIDREYMDQAVAARLSEYLQRRLADGAYVDAATPEALATQLTRDLLAASQDKHLAVTLVRRPAAPSKAATAEDARQEGVRRTNGGVRRVEILSGNVGYLDLSTFWRVEEAREAITDAMRLLERADALIVDMRRNSGGSPGAARTFSAGEGFAFLLQERKRAEVIGERTAGAANPGRPYPVGALFEVTIPNGKVRSAVGGGNWEGRGVTPDVEVAASDALRIAHDRALERLARPGPP